METQLVVFGFMGAGKSTVGRVVADRLGWDFLDLDVLVAQAAGSTIPELFASAGEEGFRELEHRVLATVAQRPRTVCALGGGTPVDGRNRALLRTADRVLLEVSVETARARVGDGTGRPLAAPGVLERRFAEREALYHSFAHLVVSVEGVGPEEVASQILVWHGPRARPGE